MQMRPWSAGLIIALVVADAVEFARDACHSHYRAH
jgi:hypothetical protein